MTPPRAGAGFTLLEVLAALVVLGLIIAGVSAALRFGQEALTAQSREIVAIDDAGPVDATLRTLIARAWPDSGGAGARFEGTAHTLSFRTRLPESIASARVRDADVAIGVDAGHQLTLTWLPWYRNWIVPKPQPQRIDLLADVDHVEFAYWDPSLNLPAGQWVTAWAGNSAPRLLRIRLVFAKGARQRWPEIIVATARDRWEF